MKNGRYFDKNCVVGWYLNDQLHRLNGPALYDLKNGWRQFWINGIQYDEDGYNLYYEKKALNEKLKSECSAKVAVKRLKI